MTKVEVTKVKVTKVEVTKVEVTKVKVTKIVARAVVGALMMVTGGAVGAADAPYPSRPVRMIVPFAPGGGLDISTRLIAQKLTEKWGQNIVVDSRPGAATIVGTEIASKAAPDGYTLLMTTISASAVVPPQMRPPPFDIYRDQQPVTLAATVPLVVVVPISSPARDLKGLIDYARAHPGALNYSSSGVATQQHLAAELLASRAGVSFRKRGSTSLAYRSMKRAWSLPGAWKTRWLRPRSV